MITAHRLKKIFLPYITINILAIIIFDILYYQNFVMREPKHDFGHAEINLPLLYLIAVNTIVTLWLLRNFDTPKKGKPVILFFLFYIFSIFPLLLSLPLVRQITQALVTVNSVNDIKDTEIQLYRIKDFYVDTTKIGESYSFTKESGRYGRKFYGLRVVFAAPINQIGTNGNNFTHW